jgi:hypothetical protein
MPGRHCTVDAPSSGPFQILILAGKPCVACASDCRKPSTKNRRWDPRALALGVRSAPRPALSRLGPALRVGRRCLGPSTISINAPPCLRMTRRAWPAHGER